MGWLMGSLFACYTVSLVVGSDEALLNSHTDARTANTYNTDGRFPILPRRKLSFRNDTSVSGKQVYTTRTSAVLTGAAVVVPTETELSSTSTSKDHGFPSEYPSLGSLSDTLLKPSSNVSSTSSALNSLGLVSIVPPITSILATASIHIWESGQAHSNIYGAASSIDPSRTAPSLAVTPEPKPNPGDSLVSTLSQDGASSRTADAKLPIITSALVYSLWDNLSTHLLSTTSSEAQEQWNQSTSSSAVLYPTTTQHAAFLASKSTLAPSPTAVVSSLQQQHVDASTETSSAFSNLGTALSTVSNASKAANGLQQHLVSSLANWAPLISSTSYAGRSSGTEVATSTATTLTKTLPQQTASASEVVENFFTSTTQAPNNTSSPSFFSTVDSEESTANAPWLSLVFTRADSQATIFSKPILSATSAIPTTSSIYTNSNFSGVIPTASQTATPQSVASSTLGPYATPVQGKSGFLPSGIYPTSASGNDNIPSRTRSDSSPQMLQTRLQLAPTSAPILPVSLVLTPIQASTPTRTVEIAETQVVSSGIFSSTTSLPCSSVSTPLLGGKNTFATQPTEVSAALTRPTISTSLKANSSTDPLVLWYMSQTSSISSTSTLPSVSTYMATCSFVTRTKASSSGPPSQTILVASDVNTTITASPRTTLLPTHSPTETVAATSSSPLTTSEAAGVAIGSTAGLLLAIVAAVFVVRRYHAARSAKQGSDGTADAYPQLAYLYDPSLKRTERDNGGDDEASTFMSGGATGRPLTPTRSKTPPAPPHNSVDFGYHRPHSSESRYSNPDNPFTDIQDPFLEWRSSDAISTPNDTRAALAAAVARYSNGPQRPLPPLPNRVSTHAFGDHIIPSPTLSPITNGCVLPRSAERSASRSSVTSQRCLRKLHCSSSGSRDHEIGQRHSLRFIHEANSPHGVSHVMQHNLLLPVDTQSATSDSVVVYASTLTHHSTPAPSANNTVSKPFSGDVPHAHPPLTHSAHSPRQSCWPEPINPNPTDISYADFPSPPTTTCTPTHRGWDEIKRTSTNHTVLISPVSPLSPSCFSPTFPSSLSPPPPLKNRSLINLHQKTRLSSIRPTSQPRGGGIRRDHQSIPAPLRIQTRCEEGQGEEEEWTGQGARFRD